MPIPIPLQNGPSDLNPLDGLNANRLAILVEFKWGTGPTYARYARHDKDVTYDGHVYTACPILDIVYGDQHGGSQDVPITITIDRTKSPADKMIGQRFTPTDVRVWECDLSDVDGSARETWAGLISLAEDNPKGKSSVVELTVNGLKADTESVLGLTVDSTCPYNPGDYLCKFPFSTHNVTSTISSILGSSVSVPPAAGFTDQPFLRWHRGIVTRDGYSIGIRGWSGTNFLLMRPPPADWVGQTVVFTPGCNGTLEACQYWGNTINFGGIGRRMQNRNPIWETGEQ